MIGYYNSMLAYYGIDTKNLSLNQWAERVAQIEDIREKEGKY
ncbi:hypothetical protein T190115A13A_60176 [Tenacibaculum sp. 190524A02b]|uniref:Uncharacterized protein n=1 Tax=Tenacibaculum vairaonense TaxID=3137860 RepID=A0ABP1FEG5_9FLAO